jgi:hypothetical protein
MKPLAQKVLLADKDRRRAIQFVGAETLFPTRNYPQMWIICFYQKRRVFIDSCSQPYEQSSRAAHETFFQPEEHFCLTIFVEKFMCCSSSHQRRRHDLVLLRWNMRSCF